MSEPDAASALLAGWAIDEQPVPVTDGVSRLTWRFGTSYLVGWEERHVAALRRELAFLGVVDLDGIDTPRVVPASDGDVCFVPGDGWVWAITDALDGAPADLGDRNHHLASVSALATVHRQLAATKPPVVRETGALAAIRDGLARGAPTVEGSEARLTIDRARRWLTEHLAELEAPQGQVVHGDWSLLNLRFTLDSPARVCGVLDFERVGFGPCELDLCQAVAGALWWSSLPDAEALAHDLVRRYEEEAGRPVDNGVLGTWLVAYWYDNWVWLEERVRAGEVRLHQPLAKQPRRMAAALAFANRGRP